MIILKSRLLRKHSNRLMQMVSHYLTLLRCMHPNCSKTPSKCFSAQAPKKRISPSSKIWQHVGRTIFSSKWINYLISYSIFAQLLSKSMFRVLKNLSLFWLIFSWTKPSRKIALKPSKSNIFKDLAKSTTYMKMRVKIVLSTKSTRRSFH